MSGLTVITVLVILVGLIGRGGYGRALALGGATPAGAALVLGDTALPTFFAAALGASLLLALTLLGNPRAADRARRAWPPGILLLVLFAGWSTLVTLLAPLLFDGLPIVSPTATVLSGGVVTSSNLAQIIYLVLGVVVAAYLARSATARPELMGLAVGTCTLLSLWRYGYTELGLPFPEDLFDNSPSFVYIQTAAGGLERFRGILSEPAALAGTSLVTIAYMLARAPLVTGWRRAGCLAVGGVALYLGVISTSATFVVGGLGIGVIMTGIWVVGFLGRRSVLNQALGVVACAVVIIGVFVVPRIVSFVESAVNDKLVSSSYTDRTSANTDSFRVFLESYGMGVGLGSARASSFAPTILSATGLIGTLLFVLAVAVLVVRSWPERSYRPVLWALVALLVVKVAAGPDLSDSSGVLWLALGLLSQAVLRRDHAANGRDPGIAPLRTRGLDDDSRVALP